MGKSLGWHRMPVKWLQGRVSMEAAFKAVHPLAVAVEAKILQSGGAAGHCVGCEKWGWFTQPPTSPGDWSNLLEGLVCTCGLNGRMRLIITALDSLLLLEPSLSKAVVFERLTPVFSKLLERLPKLKGSEYLGPEYSPGQIGVVMGREVRHESLLDPSYKNMSLDLVMHFDVLEHVPDPALALVKCYRMLRPGGWLLFSCPFYDGLEHSITRAEIKNGQLVNILDPCYHGNPVDGSGALVFSQPGWDLLKLLNAAGFSEIGALFGYNLMDGVVSNACPYVDGHMWPIVFAAKRPE